MRHVSVFFRQMAAPNLRDNVPPEHLGEAETSENAILFPKPSKVEPPRTLSPFNSPALKVQEPPPKIDPPNTLAAPLPLNAPIERSGLPAGFVDDDVIGDNDNDANAPPLPFLPGNFLRGAVSEPQQRPSRQSPPQRLSPTAAQPQQPQPRLPLGSQNAAPTSSRDPVFIPIPDLLSGLSGGKSGQRMLRRQGYAEDPVDSIRSAGRKFMG